MKWFLVFAATFVLDAVWTVYIDAVSKRKAWAASLSNAAIIALGAMLVVSYVQEPMLIVAAALGGFAGTFAILKVVRK